MTAKEIDSLIAAYSNLATQPEEEIELIGKARKISHKDYEILRPFLKARMKYSITIGNVELGGEYRVFCVHAMVGNDEYVSVSDEEESLPTLRKVIKDVLTHERIRRTSMKDYIGGDLGDR